MSAPYRIVDSRYETIVKLDKGESLTSAIALAHLFRQSGKCSRASVHGDNVDLGCADGLDTEERETVDEALG